MSNKNTAVLADRMFTVSTALLPFDNFEGLDDGDEDYGNRFVFTSAHCAFNLLCLCIAVHFKDRWSEQIASEIWRTFSHRAETEWVNQVRLDNIVISVDERLKLHDVLIERGRHININDMLNYEGTMGSIFSLLLPTRSKNFNASMQIVKERLGPERRFSFSPDNVEVFSSTLGNMLYYIAHTDGTVISNHSDAAKARGLRDLASFLIGATYAQCREFYK